MLKNIIIVFIFLIVNILQAQTNTDIKANNNKVSVRLGKDYYPQAWEAMPNKQNAPEEIGVVVEKEGTLVAIITDVDSIGFLVKQGERKFFSIILNGKDTVWGVVIGRYPKATFDNVYKKAHEGKTFVEIPRVYELVNILIAITPTSRDNNDLVESSTAYYKKVQTYFSPFKTHRAVAVIDSLLKKDKYNDIKMDSYCYDIDKGILKKKTTYHRIAWGNNNEIDAYIPIIQAFAQKSSFEKFYKQNLPFYNRQIKTYQDSIGIKDMQNWLNKNFPSTHYNCFKIILSPLVGGNQSATEFDDNGFKEAQAHVNFPYALYNPKNMKYSEKAHNITKGDIVFTELNHHFENPEFERNEQNAALLNRIPFNLDVFNTKGKAAANGYNNPLSCVEEYMNWALVCLRYVDFAPEKDLEALLQYREDFMVNYRGFTKFKEFNRFLVDIYKKRPQGKVVADLYPQIIKWFEENNH